VNLISLVVTLLAVGALLNIFFQILLGERFSFSGLMGELRDPISVAIPFGVTWAYFSHSRRKDLAATDPSPQQLIGLQYIYEYLSAFLGLGAFFIGLQQLSFFIINLAVEQPIWTNIYRGQLSIAISIVVIGLPLWFFNWRQANNRATQEGDEGNQSRSSLIRKIYLYLVMFISVMGMMTSAGFLIFQVLQALLGDPDDDLLRIALELVSLLVLFSLVIWYHGQVIRSDGRLSAKIQAAKHAEFPILVLVSEYGTFSEMLVETLSREAPTMPVAVHVIELGVPDEALSDARAVILPASIAANPGEAIRLWLQNFPGLRFVVPTAAQGWVWVSGYDSPIQNLVRQTAVMVRNLAENDNILQKRSSPWLIFSYILGGILGLVFLLILASFLIDVLN
jgi:hypothetical protein